MARSSRSPTRVFDANVTKEKKKPKEGDNVVEEALADIPSLPELKRIYYELMIRYYSHKNDYLEICCCYKAIYEIPSVKRKSCRVDFNPEENMLVFGSITAYSNAVKSYQFYLGG
ncbi:26S proteasome non-ATPase regulatory subunit 12 A [Glycine max]|nr:hypothetical protein GYH30_021635 [Glycine max]KAH1237613.1 26S proteasome non-ATPase regulatory subunit 12 A [Glycine max]